MPDDVATVILAAGAGRRLGGVAKATLETKRGSTFLAAIAALVSPQRAVVVVGGPHRAVTEAEAHRLGLEIALNPDPARGMASSVQVGFARLLTFDTDVVAALLWPVDHAQVAASTVATLIERARADRIVVPTVGGRGGHPTLFGRLLWEQLSRCGGHPDGARSVVRGNSDRVVRVDVGDVGVVRDVDTRRDLR